MKIINRQLRQLQDFSGQIWLWAATLLLFSAASAQFAYSAELAQGLYVVEQPVDTQSRRDRLHAAAEGLKTVLVRISGNQAVLENDQIKQQVRESEKYLNQFSYTEHSVASDDSKQLVIKMEFESSLVENLLRREGLATWSPNRATVLVWVVADGRQGRRFVGAADADIVEAIRLQAARRGLVVKLPSLDLDDTIAISPDELWQMNSWSAERAAAKYQADSLLIGRMTELSNGQWIGAWKFSHQGERSEIEGQAPMLSEYVGEAMDVVANQLAEKYAIVPVKMSAAGVVVRVTGINDFNDYAKAIGYFQRLAAVRYANPIQIEKSEIFIHLIADGQLQQLEQSITLGKILQKVAPLSQLEAVDYPAVQMNYRWPDQL